MFAKPREGASLARSVRRVAVGVGLTIAFLGSGGIAAPPARSALPKRPDIVLVVRSARAVEKRRAFLDRLREHGIK